MRQKIHDNISNKLEAPLWGQYSNQLDTKLVGFVDIELWKPLNQSVNSGFSNSLSSAYHLYQPKA